MALSVGSLGKIERLSAVGLLLGCFWLVRPPIGSAQAESEEAVPFLSDTFDRPDPSEEDVPSLLNALQDPDPDVRLNAVWALGEIGSEEAIAALIDILHDSDPNVRSNAVLALGEIGSEEAVAPLIDALQDPDLFVRWSAAEALGEIGSEEAGAALIDVFQNSDSGVVNAAAYALGEIDSEEAIPPLINALQDPDLFVRRSAAEALGEIGSEEAVAPLINALQDPDFNVSRSAAQALREIGSEEAVRALINALQDPDSFLRVTDIWSGAGYFSSTRLENAIPPLIKALQDSDSELRRIAAEALGAIGSGSAISPLIDALQDPELEVGRSVAKALVKISETVFWRANVNDDLQTSEKLVNALRASEDPTIRWYLTIAMQRARDPIVTAALVEQIILVEQASVNTPIENRYSAINSLTTQQHHLQNLADSQDLLKTLSDLALTEEEPALIRYGAFLLLSSVNTPEALSLLNTHQSEFLELVEANYAANLPFYLPEPINQTSSPNPPSSPSPFRDEGTLVASGTLVGIIHPPSNPIPQGIRPEDLHGAEPGETRQVATARLAGTPPVCNFEWVKKRWRRCQV
ncbi:MAG: HEAT repeat domain-containing protein [Cyanobacteria bacterium P01_C01_bin.120]